MSRSVASLVAALKTSSRARDLRMGKKVHAELDRLGHCLNAIVENSLIHMYAKCRSMAEARKIFERMDRGRRTAASWTSLIFGYVENGMEYIALEIFQRMRAEVCALDSQSIVAAIKACSSLAGKEHESAMLEKFFQMGQDLHALADESGFLADIYVCNVLIDLYAKCRRIEEARRVFRVIPRPDVVSWTSLILGHVHNGENTVGIYFFWLMQCEGCLPDGHAFVATLKAFSGLAEDHLDRSEDAEKEKLYEAFRAIALQVVCSGYESDVFVASAMLDIYSKFGDIVECRRIFERLPRRDVVSWTALILGHSQNGDAETAIDLFSIMLSEKECVPDAATFIVAVQACKNLATREEFQRIGGKLVKVKALEKGMEVHSQAGILGIDSRDVFVATSLIDFYAECGSLVNAQRVFNRMATRDVVSWTALILGYVENGESETALELFQKMRLEALETGRSLHAQIYECGLHGSELVLSTLVDLYCKCGRMGEARKVFDSFGCETKDVVIWTTLIAGYSRQGNSDEAIELFNRMQDRGLRPDGITFTFLLAACSHAGLIHKGKEYFELMRSKFGISPDIEHYHGMIDLLGRANRIEEGVAVAKTMPFKATVVTWMTVLAACEKWKNASVGRDAFESLVALDERHVAAFVSMANIYRSQGMVDEESRVLAMAVALRKRKSS